MNFIWSNEIDQILSKGRPLDEYGVRNWAFDRNLALNVLEELKEKNVPILGGDVYISDGFKLELTYDNWHCDREDGESYSEFSRRSSDVAKEYIVNYLPLSKNFCFVFVPDVDVSEKHA